jgi:hypothetical protein
VGLLRRKEYSVDWMERALLLEEKEKCKEKVEA